MKKKNWTPVDAFVTEYGFRTNTEFIYMPGSGGATFKPGLGLDLDTLRSLIKSIEHHELQICITGEVFVYVPDEEGEKPDAPEEEPIGKCPECDAPATHPSGLCRDCHQAKLETEEIPEEIVQVIEDEAETLDEEAIQERERSEEDIVVIIE